MAIYRLTFHPLAKYPGPLLSKVSGWPAFWEVKSGNRHIETWEQHEIYGWFDNNPQLGNGISNRPTHHRPHYPNRTEHSLHQYNRRVKGNLWIAEMQRPEIRLLRNNSCYRGGFSTHSIIDRQRHAFRRRVLEHAFTEPALASAEKFIRGHIRIWCKHLEEGSSKVGGWSAAKNMSDWCTYLGYDIMGNLMFGKDFHCMESDKHRYIPDLMMDTTNICYLVRLFCLQQSRMLLPANSKALVWVPAHHRIDSTNPPFPFDGTDGR